MAAIVSWDGLDSRRLEAMAMVYRRANEIATRQACGGGAARSSAAERLAAMRADMRAALRAELRKIGCPEPQLDVTASTIIMRGLRAKLAARLIAAE
ncbi:hypothetical protein [Terrarubrum flagellatum]|uniref:hypothetical protein n=1 Tax=Terrirubrum flagellatum TaxID=2895980 RepID=UPI003144E0DE